MTPSATIKIKYSCCLCGILRQEVEVIARTDENVVEWLQGIATPAMMSDHALRSPECHPTKFSEVMIPITGVDKVGGPALN